MAKLSIVVPCRNEQEALPLFYEEVSHVAARMAPVEFEFVFVDDGSTDATLPELYRAVTEEGYDCAATRRADRKGEPAIRSFFAWQFYRLMNRFSDADIVDGARDYRLMCRRVVDAVLAVGEYNRFSKGIFGWVGFRTKWVPFANAERAAGETKWSFWELFRYSIEGIVAFSTAPLAVASVLGGLLCLAAFAAIVVVIVKTLLFGDPVGGWPSLMCVVLLLGGIQLLCTGISGQYLARTYLETKKRPAYLVRETEKGLK